MARHHRKPSLKKKLQRSGILLLLLCAAILLAFAVAFSNLQNKTVQGTLLEADAVLEGEQHLIGKENGGYLLVSTDGEMETKVTPLTQSGQSVEEVIPLFGTLVRMVSDERFLYVVTVSSVEDEDTTPAISRISIDGSDQPDSFSVLLWDVGAIDWQSLSVTDDGVFYGIDQENHCLVSFQWEEDAETISEMESVPISFAMVDDESSAEAFRFSGLSLFGDDYYLVATDDDENSTVYRGIFSDGVLFLISDQPLAEMAFPVMFLREDLAVDKSGVLYKAEEGAFYPVSDSPVFLDVAADSQGNLIGMVSDQKLAWYDASDLVNAQGIRQTEDGTLCAVGCNDTAAFLLHNNDGYYFMTWKDLPLQEDSSSQPSEVESSDTESGSSAPSLPDDSSEDMGETSSALDNSEELEMPVESGLTSSEVESTASTEEVVQITSTEYVIDRSSHTTVLPERTTVAAFRKTVNLQGCTLSVVKPDGSAVKNGKLGTGMVLQLYQGDDLMDEIVVVVKGDLSGNGEVNSSDEKLLYQHLTGETPLTGYFYTASDMDSDGVVDTGDLLLLQKKTN